MDLLSIFKLTQLLGLILAVSVSLTACQWTQRPTGQPVVIQRDGSKLLVVVCADLELQGATMQQRKYPDAWQTFWEFDSILGIRDGEELSPSQSETLGLAPGSEPDMTANREIAIFLDGEEQPGWGKVTATFLIGEEGLSESTWLHDDESVSSKPCE